MSSKAVEFGERVRAAVEESVVRLLARGEWIQPDYSTRIKLDLSTIRSVYDAVDMERVKARVIETVEVHIADKIFNAMATEIGTDVKQILSNTELREDMRSIIRAKIRESTDALSTPKSTP